MRDGPRPTDTRDHDRVSTHRDPGPQDRSDRGDGDRRTGMDRLFAAYWSARESPATDEVEPAAQTAAAVPPGPAPESTPAPGAGAAIKPSGVPVAKPVTVPRPSPATSPPAPVPAAGSGPQVAVPRPTAPISASHWIHSVARDAMGTGRRNGRGRRSATTPGPRTPAERDPAHRSLYRWVDKDGKSGWRTAGGYADSAVRSWIHR
jgi:hypothetical protein